MGATSLSPPPISRSALQGRQRTGSARYHAPRIHASSKIAPHRNSSGVPSSLIALPKTAGVSTSSPDLTSFASVKKLKADARDVDTFVGNAATVTQTFAKTEDGWETAFVFVLGEYTLPLSSLTKGYGPRQRLLIH
ncbi:hypothetical protein B0H14DRAFT_2591204 [Mycena olivaceomarginata]|nr:hypothetical protein B0H14DRAFT_2591204 [Mycena olivaceomarginata]